MILREEDTMKIASRSRSLDKFQKCIYNHVGRYNPIIDAVMRISGGTVFDGPIHGVRLILVPAILDYSDACV